MMTEIWLPAYNLDGCYEVSDLGRIRNKFGRLVAQCATDDGYLRSRLITPFQGKINVRVHRLVASTFIRPPYEGEQVNHRDFDKTNNALTNLEWVTPTENVAHARKSGRCRDKLDKARVLDIKRRALNGEVLARVASIHGVSSSTITRVLDGDVYGGIGFIPKSYRSGVGRYDRRRGRADAI